MELTDAQRLSYGRYALAVVRDANLDFVRDHPGRGELGFTRHRLHAAILARATVSSLIDPGEYREPIGCEEHCARLYHRVPGWLRREVHRIVDDVVAARLAPVEAET